MTNAGDEVVGFLDDAENLPKTFAGSPILGKVEDYQRYQASEFIIAIGNALIRQKIAEKLKNVNWYTAIHPSAAVSEIDCKIGKGTVVMPNAVINAGAKIGEHCIINTGAIVEHDNILENYVHISVGAKLAGTVHVGRATWIGIGASVSNNLSICENCMIGAGAVVVKDITESGTYIGVPARRMK